MGDPHHILCGCAAAEERQRLQVSDSEPAEGTKRPYDSPTSSTDEEHTDVPVPGFWNQRAHKVCQASIPFLKSSLASAAHIGVGLSISKNTLLPCRFAACFALQRMLC